ncbi:MAG: YncE family protein [Terriglobales bacterium]
MKTRMRNLAGSMAVLLAATGVALAQSAPRRAPAEPKRIAVYTIPASVQGRFDHLALDIPGHRLFLAAETAHEVLVFNSRNGRYEKAITGIGIPHDELYRPRIARLFVTDGGAGEVRVYNGHTLAQVGTVRLKVDSDSTTYNPRTQRLYVVNGGGDAHLSYSDVSVIDTNRDVKVADIQLPGDTVEQLTFDLAAHRLYAANPPAGEVDVISMDSNKLLARWKVTLGKGGSAIAVDPATHRLFLGCRSGVIVICNTQTGKELQTLKIARGIDDLIFNPATLEMFAPCSSGTLFVYREDAPDRYSQVAAVATARGAKNIAFDAGSGQLYTTVPPGPGRPGRVFVYQMAR